MYIVTERFVIMVLSNANHDDQDSGHDDEEGSFMLLEDVAKLCVASDKSLLLGVLLAIGDGSMMRFVLAAALRNLRARLKILVQVDPVGVVVDAAAAILPLDLVPGGGDLLGPAARLGIRIVLGDGVL